MIKGLQEIWEQVGYQTTFHDAEICSIDVDQSNHSVIVHLTYVPYVPDARDGEELLIKLIFGAVQEVSLQLGDWSLDSLVCESNDRTTTCSMVDLSTEAESHIVAKEIRFEILSEHNLNLKYRALHLELPYIVQSNN